MTCLITVLITCGTPWRDRTICGTSLYPYGYVVCILISIQCTHCVNSGYVRIRLYITRAHLISRSVRKILFETLASHLLLLLQSILVWALSHWILLGFLWALLPRRVLHQYALVALSRVVDCVRQYGIIQNHFRRFKKFILQKLNESLKIFNCRIVRGYIYCCANDIGNYSFRFANKTTKIAF
jgi:hypothetical protein